MSHITIVISRAQPPEDESLAAEQDGITATVRYPVPHDATDAEVGQAVKRLVKQVRELGS